MKLKGCIEHVGALVTGTTAEGKPWQKRTLTISHIDTLDDGQHVTERFVADYFGDVQQDTLLQLAADRVCLDFTIFFSVREYTDKATGQTRKVQFVVLKKLARSI